jgi:hypothetical protein
VAGLRVDDRHISLPNMLVVVVEEDYNFVFLLLLAAIFVEEQGVEAGHITQVTRSVSRVEFPGD